MTKPLISADPRKRKMELPAVPMAKLRGIANFIDNTELYKIGFFLKYNIES
jgi:hypothetical protein